MSDFDWREIESLLRLSIYSAHGIDTSHMSDLAALKTNRRLNQLFRLAVYLEMYRREHAAYYHPSRSPNNIHRDHLIPFSEIVQ